MKTLENNYVEDEFKKLLDSDDDFFESNDIEEQKFRKLKGKALYIAS